MTTSAFQPNPSDGAVVPELSLLDAVLQQTSVSETLSPNEREQLAPLLVVARKYRGSAMCFEPVLVELVRLNGAN